MMIARHSFSVTHKKVGRVFCEEQLHLRREGSNHRVAGNMLCSGSYRSTSVRHERFIL